MRTGRPSHRLVHSRLHQLSPQLVQSTQLPVGTLQIDIPSWYAPDQPPQLVYGPDKPPQLVRPISTSPVGTLQINHPSWCGPDQLPQLVCSISTLQVGTLQINPSVGMV